MIVVPVVMPVTTPAADIVPTEVLLLLHVPPPVGSVNGVVAPEQTVVVPEMAAGVELTVTVVVTVPQLHI